MQIITSVLIRTEYSVFTHLHLVEKMKVISLKIKEEKLDWNISLAASSESGSFLQSEMYEQQRS